MDNGEEYEMIMMVLENATPQEFCEWLRKFIDFLIMKGEKDWTNKLMLLKTLVGGKYNGNQ